MWKRAGLNLEARTAAWMLLGSVLRSRCPAGSFQSPLNKRLLFSAVRVDGNAVGFVAFGLQMKVEVPEKMYTSSCGEH